MLQHQPVTPRTKTHALTRLVAKLDRMIALATASSSTLTRWRLILFIIGAVCTVALYKMGWYQAGNGALIAFVALFIIVAAYHNRLESRLHRLRLWKQIKLVHLARLRLDWQQIPARPSSTPEQHPYAKDLDLVGPHSLIRLLDTTVSSNGQARLASWLLEQPPEPDQWLLRRRLVQELIPRSLFRDRLGLEAQLIGEQEINGRRLEAVLQHRVGFPHLTTVLAIQVLLAAATIGLGLSALLDWLPNYWMWSFATYALLYFWTDQGEELLEHAVGVHFELEKLGAVLGFVQRHARPRHSALAGLWAPLLAPDVNPPQLVRQAARTLHAISVKAHPLIHLIVNAFCPWDLWFTYRLQQIQAQVADHLPIWLDRLAEVEAASALATFAALHPSYRWPTPLTADLRRNGASARLSAKDLGHPLIAEMNRISNDLSLETLGTVFLVTGSNMSGKSTFLRTLGINLCLAQAGAPVCASLFEWTWVRLATCIRVDDSLEAGLSFFYAEVKRLKTLLDATANRSSTPVLFLIDEIFKGTNNRERLIGSRAFITALSQGNGFGLVTTHDLELTDLHKTVPGLRNAHFQETVAAGALQFDYKLRPGPCPTTNALRIMELEGLPVPKGETGEKAIDP
ncbi:MAG TPA: MutS family DNA mismatch repair protein [Nitrospiraceae bacterium]|nr:MutS family DNA mismatch repair protein [Nitrospiraceae bacterium]